MAERIETDVAVVGAGPAGVAAACRAAECGARVVLVDENPRPGGQIWRHGAAAAIPAAARAWLARLQRSGARLVMGAAVVDAAPEAWLLVEQGGHCLRIEARQLVLATGARELFLPFPGWTLPNVMGVGAAQALLKSGVSFRGREVVVAGSGPLLLPVAAALAAAGARLRLVAEQAPAADVRRFAAGLWRQPGRLAQAARYRAGFLRTPYRTGVWIAAARGDGRLQQVTLTDGRATWSMACDLLCCAHGLVPNLELPRLLRCGLAQGAVAVDEQQRTSLAAVYCAGEPTGVGGVERALVEGEIAGLAAADQPAEAGLRARRARLRRFAAALRAAFRPRDELRRLADPRTLVCRCEDVALSRLQPGWGMRQAKLVTRTGMGPCQGRICGPALEFLFGWEPDTVRPPLKPVALSILGEEP